MNDDLLSKHVCSINEINPDAVAWVQERTLPEDLIDQLSRLFSTFGDPTRLKIIHALSIKEELCVCDLAVIAGLSVSAVSHQLRLLRDRNVVASRRDGRMVYYRLKDAHVSEIMKTGIEHAQE